MAGVSAINILDGDTLFKEISLGAVVFYFLDKIMFLPRTKNSIFLSGINWRTMTLSVAFFTEMLTGLFVLNRPLTYTKLTSAFFSIDFKASHNGLRETLMLIFLSRTDVCEKATNEVRKNMMKRIVCSFFKIIVSRNECILTIFHPCL